jgi:hypothetical protein
MTRGRVLYVHAAGNRQVDATRNAQALRVGLGAAGAGGPAEAPAGLDRADAERLLAFLALSGVDLSSQGIPSDQLAAAAGVFA